MHKLLLSVSLLALPLAAHAASKSTETPLATPPGITLQPLGKAQGYDLGKATAAALPRDEIAYADSRGLTLYTHDKDPGGKSACNDECALFWLPVEASPDAKNTSNWSVIKRNDGRLQWALYGKPVYHFVKDVDPGSVHGNSPARSGAKRLDGAGNPVGYDGRVGGRHEPPKDNPLPPDWKIALMYPARSSMIPTGIAIREVADATALALVDYRERTLYSFTGDPKQDSSDSKMWTPVPAPQLAEAIGDFSAVVRDDGIKQWAYKGRPLYTYAQDHVYGDAYGVGVDQLHEVAAAMRYFMPDGVTISNTPSQGKVLANANGMTLYRRDANIWQSGGGHSLRRGQPARPAVGRDIGTNARCTGECAKHWHPFRAPDDAQAQGYWTVGTLPDGGKQWMYQDYALWTFDGDKKPGDMNGHDSYEFAFSNDPVPTKVLEVGTPQDGIPGLYWAVQAP